MARPPTPAPEDHTGVPPRAAPAPHGQPHRSVSGWLLWIVGSAGIVLIGAIIILVALRGTTASAPAQVEPGINQRTAALLQLDPIGGLGVKAHPFTLTDQNGAPMTLKEFAGRPVVLTFNDDQCTDLCTLLAQDVVTADHDLGTTAKKIAFVSINANPYYPSVASVKAWSDTHGLGRTTNWYYGTATPATLSRLAADYGVPIELDAANKTVVHGTEIFFITPTGRESALGQFGTESADTGPFAHAIARAADDLLPAAQRTTVAGPSLPQTGGTSTTLGATPAPITLPALSGGGKDLTTAADRGKYLVLNFWASTCTACVSEMPGLQDAHQHFGSAVDFLGIDVSDNPSAARAFARRVGVTYPLASDRSGRVSGQYQITGLPYTLILSPTGKVLIRHPGILTTEQLDYLLEMLDPHLGNS